MKICVLLLMLWGASGCAEHASPASADTISPSDWIKISFAGYDWRVKTSRHTLAGPGPNYFSDSGENVWLDQAGWLHLRITQREGRWYCPEVVSVKSFGYGTYRFSLTGQVDQLNEHVVVGLFTWDDDPAEAHREIDIELSRWGDRANANVQFVVQPYTHSGNLYRFDAQLNGADSAYSFEWSQAQIVFQAAAANEAGPAGNDRNLAEWQYTGQDIPHPGYEQARMNVWLFNGEPPSDGQEVEVVVKKFEFTPLPK